MPAEVQAITTTASHWVWLLNFILPALLIGGFLMFLRQKKMDTAATDNQLAVMGAASEMKKDTSRLIEQHKYPDEHGFGSERTNRMLKDQALISGEHLKVSQEICEQSKANSLTLQSLVRQSQATTQESTQVNQALLDYLKKNGK